MMATDRDFEADDEHSDRMSNQDADDESIFSMPPSPHLELENMVYNQPFNQVNHMAGRPIHCQGESSTDKEPEDDSGSDTTLYFGEESYTTFRRRVRRLALTTIWPGARLVQVSVFREKSYGYERCVRAEFERRNGQRQRVLIRVPWKLNAGAEPVENCLAQATFIQKYIPSIYIHDIVDFDKSANNEVESQYYVQRYVPGQILSSIWRHMLHAKKCEVARQLGYIYQAMLATTSTASGRLGFDESGNHVVIPYTLCKPSERYSYVFEPLASESPSGTYAACCSGVTTDSSRANIFNDITSLVDGWIELGKKKCQNNESLKDIWDTWYLNWHESLNRIAALMARSGYFDDVPISLYDPYFDPGTWIYTPASSSNDSLTITLRNPAGYEFGPAFVGCRPPRWLWSGEYPIDVVHETDPGVSINLAMARCNETPSSRNGREIKEIFDKAGGETYRHFAYSRNYVAARRLWKYAITGGSSSKWSATDAKHLAREWDMELGDTWPESDTEHRDDGGRPNETPETGSHNPQPNLIARREAQDGGFDIQLDGYPPYRPINGVVFLP